MDRVREHKKQVWFRADQAELTIDCLRFVHGKLNTELSPTGAHAMAARYTRKRLEEVIALFGLMDTPT